jgi:site-specific recombinase XerD
MAAKPTDPLVASFLRRKRRWSDAYIANAVSQLNRWCAWLAARGVDLCDATGDDCSDYLRERSQVVAGSTVHKDWQMLVWLYTWLAREGELPPVKRRGQLVDQSGRGPMNDIDAPGISDPDPDRVRHISAADYRRLMASFDRTKVLDCRNAAICSLMYWSGCRMSEVARADADRYDASEGCVEIFGKNGKWRTVTLLEETREWLDRYLRRRDRIGDTATALFASTLGGHEGTTTGRLRPDAIASMLERRCAKLGIHVTAHQFRRAFTIDAKRRGVGETEIARQAGWAPSTSKLMIPRYTKSDADKLTHEAFRANDPTAVGARRRLRAV